MSAQLDSVESWQSKIDHDFPKGLTMTWEGRDFSPTFPIPCVVITSVTDNHPYTQFFVYQSDRCFEMQLTSYEEIQTEPFRVVRVSSQSSPNAFWSGNVSDELALAMGAEVSLIRQTLGSVV
jgi:hypothetical protein